MRQASADPEKCGKLDETLEEDLRSFKTYAEAREPAAVSRG